MILKESHLRRPRKKDLKQALIQKIMKKKSWLMTSLMVKLKCRPVYYTNNHPFNCYYITITYSLYSNYEGYTRVTKGTLRKGTRG